MQMSEIFGATVQFCPEVLCDLGELLLTEREKKDKKAEDQTETWNKRSVCLKKLDLKKKKHWYDRQQRREWGVSLRQRCVGD